MLQVWRLHKARRSAARFNKETRRMMMRAGVALDADVKARLVQALAALNQSTRGEDVAHMQQCEQAVLTLIDAHLGDYQKPAWRESMESIGVAVCVALVLRSFVFEAFKIPSGSMIPSLSIGDQIFVNKYIYGVRIPFTTTRLINFAPPQRGEVVVFVCPIEPHEDYIKRIIGLPGDVVQVSGGVIRINGEVVERQALGQVTEYDRDGAGDGWRTFEANAYREKLGEHSYVTLEDVEPFRRARDFGPATVPAHHVLCMGDNRDHSYDSRAWGMVPQDAILGRSMFVWWSYGHGGIAFRRIGTWID